MQVLNACGKCTAKFAVGLSRCPHCGSTKFMEDWQMPKITEHGGATNAAAEPPTPSAAATAPGGEPGPELTLPTGAFVATTGAWTDDAETKTGPEEESSPGSSSETSSEKPPTTSETSSSAPQSPAPTTASPSKRTRKASSSAPSTATAGPKTDGSDGDA